MDNGFLDRFPRRPPTVAERVKFAQWAALLEGAEAGQGPHPATENWQKAIGSHVIWLSGLVTLTGTIPRRSYTVMLTLHAEDRHNFNPGAEDIATGIPDDANGVFEVTGLAQQYMNYSTLTRTLSWAGETAAPAQVSRLNARRERAPGDNRRARNRI